MSQPTNFEISPWPTQSDQGVLFIIDAHNDLSLVLKYTDGSGLHEYIVDHSESDNENTMLLSGPASEACHQLRQGRQW